MFIGDQHALVGAQQLLGFPGGGEVEMPEVGGGEQALLAAQAPGRALDRAVARALTQDQQRGVAVRVVDLDVGHLDALDPLARRRVMWSWFSGW